MWSSSPITWWDSSDGCSTISSSYTIGSGSVSGSVSFSFNSLIDGGSSSGIASSV